MTRFHDPVLVDELCEALAPALTPSAATPAPVLVDATCGGAGHTQALLERTGAAQVLCFDRDRDALAHAAQRLAGARAPVRMLHVPFSRIAQTLGECGLTGVSAIVADLGVSSHQLDTPERGFSFGAEGQLDMRMDRSRGHSAAEVLAEIEPEELARVLREYGQEREARRIARAIVAARPSSTRALAQVVTEAMTAASRRALGRRIHPATRTFQALRILVNDELGELDRFLEVAPGLLLVGGRLGVISFHSLEDRRVKRCFHALSRPPQPPAGVPLRRHELPRPRFAIPTGYARGVTASAAERERNPRARSARLRVLERRAG